MGQPDDIFDVVDEQDQVIGSAPRSEVHGKGLRHRAIRGFVFNQKGEILLQLRSANKDKHPRTWDTSCAGHVDSGETYQNAAVREMGEELGLSPCPPLEEMGKCAACEQTGQEFVTVYRTRCEGPFLFCEEEIDDVRWISVPAMEREFQQVPDTYAPALPYLWKQFRDTLR